MKPKILVIDDSPQISHLLGAALDLEGYQVKVASNATDGLEQVRFFQPDLVLLDILMPIMDGWETLSRLREFSVVPVIMVTALGGTQNVVRALEGGADDFVIKPFSVDSLLARIRAILRRSAYEADRAQTLSGRPCGAVPPTLAKKQPVVAQKMSVPRPLDGSLFPPALTDPRLMVFDDDARALILGERVLQVDQRAFLN